MFSCQTALASAGTTPVETPPLHLTHPAADTLLLLLTDCRALTSTKTTCGPLGMEESRVWVPGGGGEKAPLPAETGETVSHIHQNNVEEVRGPRHAKQLVCSATCSFNSCAEHLFKTLVLLKLGFQSNETLLFRTMERFYRRRARSPPSPPLPPSIPLAATFPHLFSEFPFVTHLTLERFRFKAARPLVAVPDGRNIPVFEGGGGHVSTGAITLAGDIIDASCFPLGQIR